MTHVPPSTLDIEDVTLTRTQVDAAHATLRAHDATDLIPMLTPDPRHIRTGPAAPVHTITPRRPTYD